MRFAWSEAKRKTNLELHGFDFVDAPKVFAGPTKMTASTTRSQDLSRSAFSKD